MNKPKVYFLGSGNIAIAPLQQLFNSARIDLVGIATQIDRPAGRKKIPQPTPVGLWADKNGIAIDKPDSVNNEDFLDKLRSIEPDIIFVASFGQLLKSEILELPAVACVNLHASILPAYRGAAPIISAIVDGLDKTGISFMKMDKGLDTGPVYCIYEQELKNQKANELETQLGIMAAEYIEEVIEKIVSGEMRSYEQDHDKATFAAKIKKGNGQVDWSEAAEVIERKIRGYFPWPGTFFVIQTRKRPIRLNINEAEIVMDKNGTPGKTLVADKHDWIIACGDGAINLKKVKPDGKGEMTGPEFVRGRPELFH